MSDIDKAREIARRIAEVYPDRDRIPEDSLRLTHNGIAEIADDIHPIIAAALTEARAEAMEAFAAWVASERGPEPWCGDGADCADGEAYGDWRTEGYIIDNAREMAAQIREAGRE
jgi:hypothetical protein